MNSNERMEPSHCLVCGEKITDMTWQQDLMPVADMVVYGIPISTTGLVREEPVPGSQRYTWQCGHEYRGQITVYQDAPARLKNPEPDLSQYDPARLNLIAEAIAGGEWLPLSVRYAAAARVLDALAADTDSPAL